MSESGGDWRSGPAYEYLDEIGVEKIAHEFLRRNDQYAADYATLRAKSPDEHSAPALARWGLRFRGGPTHPRRSGDHGLASASRSALGATGPASGWAVHWPEPGRG